MGVRAGIVGLQSVYLAQCFCKLFALLSADAELVACADLDYDPNLISTSLGKTPVRICLPRTISDCIMIPTEMIQNESLDAVCISVKEHRSC